MPNTFQESTWYLTIREALSAVTSVWQAQNFFQTYVGHLLQAEKWQTVNQDMNIVAKRLIAAVLREDQRTYWEGILSEWIK